MRGRRPALCWLMLTLLPACDDEWFEDERTPECEPGSLRCIDDHQRQVCGADGFWATAPGCAHARCAEGQCHDTCGAGSRWCYAESASDCSLPNG